MTTPPPPGWKPDEPQLPTVAVSGFGCLGAAIVGYLASLVWPPENFHAWLLVLAVFVGVFAAKVADPAAVLATTAAAMLVFVGLSTSAGSRAAPVSDVVGYWIPIGFAAVLGRGQRWLRGTARTDPDDHDGLSG
jgi:hypothetical protein